MFTVTSLQECEVRLFVFTSCFGSHVLAHDIFGFVPRLGCGNVRHEHEHEHGPGLQSFLVDSLRGIVISLLFSPILPLVDLVEVCGGLLVLVLYHTPTSYCRVFVLCHLFSATTTTPIATPYTTTQVSINTSPSCVIVYI